MVTCDKYFYVMSEVRTIIIIYNMSYSIKAIHLLPLHREVCSDQAKEFTTRKRLSSAVANLLTRTHSLDNARKSSLALLSLARAYVKERKPLLNLPDINIESLIFNLKASMMLKYQEIFEFLKICASYQSDPYKSLVQIAEEVAEVLGKRPSQWVTGNLGVLQTYDITSRNDRYTLCCCISYAMHNISLYAPTTLDLSCLRVRTISRSSRSSLPRARSWLLYIPSLSTPLCTQLQILAQKTR